jgi:hypothetical protein
MSLREAIQLYKQGSYDNSDEEGNMEVLVDSSRLSDEGGGYNRRKTPYKKTHAESQQSDV